MAMYLCAECLEEKKVSPFLSGSKKEFERHMIVGHAKWGFGTIECRRCFLKFYDYEHFMEHLKPSAITCYNKPHWTDYAKLTPEMRDSFDVMLKEVMLSTDSPSLLIPAQTPIPPVPSTPSGAKSTVQNSSVGADCFDVMIIHDDAENKRESKSFTPDTPKQPIAMDNAVQMTLPEEDHQPNTSQQAITIKLATVKVEKMEESQSPIREKLIKKLKRGRGRKINTAAGGEDGDQRRKRPPKCAKRFLQLCQLCLELENDRPPIFHEKDRKEHVYLHMKYSVTYRNMTPAEIRRTPKYAELMKMCFEEGYYEMVKRSRDE